MADFLILLGKINLAMTVAILTVALLRRPVRSAFHASVGYALWLLVPTAGLASLIPPRNVAVTVPGASLNIPFLLTSTQQTHTITQAMPVNWDFVLFASWLVGTGAMLLFQAWQQRQFYKAERLGVAGPAVTGLVRPRIVIPSGFAAQFTVPEQAAILAHEEAHLARHDAQVNALIALTRSFCWFNPLIHIGAVWLRKDQELACDAASLNHVSRIDYANALLKSQIPAIALPLGCSWPGGEHPLTERIAMLKQVQPNPLHRTTGITFVVLLTGIAGVSAWAAQPPQTNVSNPLNYAKNQQTNIHSIVHFIATALQTDPRLVDDNRKVREDLFFKKLATLTQSQGLSAAYILDSTSHILGSSKAANAEDPPSPTVEYLAQAKAGQIVVDAPQSNMTRALIHLGQPYGDIYLEVVRLVETQKDASPPVNFFYTRSVSDKANSPSNWMTLEAGRNVENGDTTEWLDNVKLQMPYGMALSDKAIQSDWVKEKKFTMTGNVRLFYGDRTLRGQVLTFNLTTGLLDLDGKTMPSGMRPNPACGENSQKC